MISLNGLSESEKLDFYEGEQEKVNQWLRAIGCKEKVEGFKNKIGEVKSPRTLIIGGKVFSPKWLGILEDGQFFLAGTIPELTEAIFVFLPLSHFHPTSSKLDGNGSIIVSI